ncbi:hypothetical protein BDD12DRAFT_744544 [Trichophaea hybrida]|nr:hypothetical protein BDD12DRAFT_744544 [Trichophaea hybrida]
MGIKAVFLVIASFIHGYVRLSTPRLFLMVLLMIIPVLIGLTSTAIYVSHMFPIQFFYPILTAVAIMLLVNVAVFPEFGSTQLCMATIETLQEVQKVQKSAAELFIAFSVGKDPEECVSNLRDLTKSKAELRSKVEACKAVYTECSFELAYSVLAPRELKPISGKGIKNLMGKTLNLVGACESVYALLGIEPKNLVDLKKLDVDRLKPRREELGDEELLKGLLKRQVELVEVPLTQLQSATSRALDIVSACVAFAYDTPSIPTIGKSASRARRPNGILLQEIDIHIEWLDAAITEFGNTSTAALEIAAALQGPQDVDVDLMPREEVFLISSFVMNLRHGASHTLDMLRHSRVLVEERANRKGRKSLHFPRIKMRKWLFSSTEESDTLRISERETFARDLGNDHESSNSFNDKNRTSRLSRDRKTRITRPKLSQRWRKFRWMMGKCLDWMAHSDSIIYALKFTLGVMLVAWPAFVSNWVQWYTLIRGVWAPLIFVLVFENAVGSTIWIFFLRTVGTIVGSVWGYVAYQSRHGNEFTIAVILMLGTIPNYYVQLGTKYQKAGMVCTISMCVVALSTHLQTVPGTSEENFYKRVITMLIGGIVATLVQLVLFPVKARVHLKEFLASAIVQINKMESCIASGIDDTRNIVSSPALFKRFGVASKKASTSLSTAEAFLEFTKQEPRLKGSFAGHAIVYKEIIFVLRQIVDRMENMVQLRQTYGSAVLEQYNSRVYNYRRNVAATITLTLCVVHEALTTKLALPQFLPSARLAHLRMVLRVRQILLEENTISNLGGIDARADSRALAARHTLRLKLLSWNASSAALEECIEYLEELVDLAKALVGANEFRSGILNRPNYKEYIEQIRSRRDFTARVSTDPDAPSQDTAETVTASGFSIGRVSNQALEGMPDSLTRIQSRRMEAKMERRRTSVMPPHSDT